MDVVIIHGTFGCSDDNWFPWLKEKMEELGHNVYVPKFPTPENQNKESWCEALRNQAPIFGKDTIIVGHSLGAVMLLHILEVVSEPIAKSVFVSGFLEELGNEKFDILNSSFVNHNFDWKTINKNKGDAFVFHGNGDPYVPNEQAEKLGRNLNIEPTIIENGGHLNTKAGFTKFEELLKSIT